MYKKIMVIVLSITLTLMTGCMTKTYTSDTVNEIVADQSAYGETSEEGPSDAAIDTVEELLSFYSNLDVDISTIPEYTGSPYIDINDNVPYFADYKSSVRWVEYNSELDKLGRCQMAFMDVSKDKFPEEERVGIAGITPSGWQNHKYDFIDQGYLYNRCHILAYMFSGEDDETNLITGTRYMNVEGMLPFEMMIRDYVYETGNRVAYRVSPIFYEDELVARGVQMEAYSIEDKGRGVSFNVFCYNVQPGVIIDYSTGENWLDELNVPGAEEKDESVDDSTVLDEYTYILNKNSMKIHKSDCDSVKDMTEHNKIYTDKCLEELVSEGYTSCGNCKP